MALISFKELSSEDLDLDQKDLPIKDEHKIEYPKLLLRPEKDFCF